MPEIPKIQRQVAPQFQNVKSDARLNIPSGAFGENVGQALSGLGQSVNKLGQILNDIETDRRKNKILVFENEVNTQYKNLTLGLQDGTIKPEDAQTYINQYDEFVNTRGKELLGDNLFKDWSAGRGQRLNAEAKVGLMHGYVSYQNKLNIQEGEILNNNVANEALINPQKEGFLINQRQQEIDLMSLPKADKEKLKYGLRRAYTLGAVERDGKGAPRETYDKLTTNKDAYAELTPSERIKKIADLAADIKKKEGSAAEIAENAFDNLFNYLRQYDDGKNTADSVVAAVKSGRIAGAEFLEDFIKENDITTPIKLLEAFSAMPDTMKEYYGLDKKKYSALQNSWQTWLKDPNTKQGMEQALNFQSYKNQFQRFGVVQTGTDENGLPVFQNRYGQKLQEIADNPAAFAELFTAFEDEYLNQNFYAKNEQAAALLVQARADFANSLAASANVDKVETNGTAAQQLRDVLFNEMQLQTFKDFHGETIQGIMLGSMENERKKKGVLKKYSSLAFASLAKEEALQMNITVLNLQNFDNLKDFGDIYVNVVRAVKTEKTLENGKPLSFSSKDPEVINRILELGRMFASQRLFEKYGAVNGKYSAFVAQDYWQNNARLDASKAAQDAPTISLFKRQEKRDDGIYEVVYQSGTGNILYEKKIKGK